MGEEGIGWDSVRKGSWRGGGETYSGKWKGKHVFHEDFKEEGPWFLR